MHIAKNLNNLYAKIRKEMYMKDSYYTPEIEIIIFDIEDVLTTSAESKPDYELPAVDPFA